MTRATLLRLGLSVGLLGAALLALHSQLGHLEPREVVSHMRSIPGWRIAAAACVTAANYLQLTLYDVLGLLYLGREVQYSRIAPASFVAIAFGHNVGPSLLSGGTVRYRFYSERGLSGSEIAILVAFTSVTFAVGYAWIAGLMFSSVSDTMKLPLPPAAMRIVGIVLLCFAGTYATLAGVGFKTIRLGRKCLTFPSLPLALAQSCVAAVDWLAMALILSLLLPVDISGYWHVLRLLLIAQIAGVISQVPGGLGIFESVMVGSLGTQIPIETVLGTLVVYRLLYHLAPFLAAVLGLALYELRRHCRSRSFAADRGPRS